MFLDVLVRPAGHREKEKWVPPHHTGKPVKNVKNTPFKDSFFFHQEEYKFAYKHCSWPHIILSRFHKKAEKVEK
jgi:hypothetical protein